MSEYLTTMGDTGAEAGVTWNSTKYPGVCKPSDFSTLFKFQELQRQINRVAEKKGLAKIAADGDLGAGTVSAWNKAMGTNVTSCSTLAGNVTAFTAQAKVLADTLGAPAQVAGPAPVQAPTVVTPSGEVKTPPPGASTGIGAKVYDAFDKLGTPGKVAAVGIFGGIAFLIATKKKRRK